MKITLYNGMKSLAPGRAMLNIIVSEKPWHKDMAQNLKDACGGEWVHLNCKEQLSVSTLQNLNPSYVFLPHWSYIIGPEIYDSYRCVVFHMTDLPYGRGGTPLQNLIAHGNVHTKIFALQCCDGIDTGDIYLKSPLRLHGTAREIFERATLIMEGMIYTIVTENPIPQPQKGEPTLWSRRRKPHCNAAAIENPKDLYDHIRMLDCEGYPPAYLETDKWRLEFNNASIDEDEITTTVTIRKL